MTYYDQVSEAVAYLRNVLGPLEPRIGIVLGSGLGAVADAVIDPVVIPYAAIPNFPQASVEGHSGQIVAGHLNNTPVIIMQGRVHYYEGYSPLEITFPMRVLGMFGVRVVVLTNAAGAMLPGCRLGQLVLLSDHINLMGFNPLIGENDPRFAARPGTGLRFTDMTEVYSRHLRALAFQAAALDDVPVIEGVYVAVSGPSFETPAEIRAFRKLGATLVGMSTVPEAIVARHMGIEVLALSCVTNLAAGLGTSLLSHEEVFMIGRRTKGRLARLLQHLAPLILSHLHSKS
jgi:purine-nucleoside phosphorylase